MNQPGVAQLTISANASDNASPIVMPAVLFLHFLERASELHLLGLKSYGIFLSCHDVERYEFRPTEVYFCDSQKNRRNEPEHRAQFEAQGAYFRRYDDAGFVADARELLQLQKSTRRSGHLLVGLFHSHRRQPANFSLIDYKLHNPLFSWHLVLSMRDPIHPQVQPFVIDKSLEDYGIDATDVVEDEGEMQYVGPEVRPTSLIVEGCQPELEEVKIVLSYNKFCESLHSKRMLAD